MAKSSQPKRSNDCVFICCQLLLLRYTGRFFVFNGGPIRALKGTYEIPRKNGQKKESNVNEMEGAGVLGGFAGLNVRTP